MNRQPTSTNSFFFVLVILQTSKNWSISRVVRKLISFEFLGSDVSHWISKNHQEPSWSLTDDQGHQGEEKGAPSEATGFPAEKLRVAFEVAYDFIWWQHPNMLLVICSSKKSRSCVVEYSWMKFWQTSMSYYVASQSVCAPPCLLL